ncbi:hypothetical protein PpBr36_05395 [Pyricularia pennisetigena]|uniref:hypothetical protein n=1 Tax=Pyricularia pennisetigena TaxID=1578925 RepID=UPI001152CECD|nr:hypothetical protein PpBr36_05395 [Pyricularia pennisetigena]TLS27553.1 hypothetical protein PpBr36_05395 [Pyricularia pennisetigena]
MDMREGRRRHRASKAKPSQAWLHGRREPRRTLSFFLGWQRLELPGPLAGCTSEFGRLERQRQHHQLAAVRLQACQSFEALIGLARGLSPTYGGMSEPQTQDSDYFLLFSLSQSLLFNSRSLPAPRATMQYSLAAILALAGSAIAQTPGFHALVKPVRDEVIPAGKPFTLEWQAGGQDGPVNFVLTGGETHALLQEIGTVATGIDSKLGKYTWNVDASLGDKKAYGLKIVLASDPTIFQWSNPFTIKASSDKTVANSTSTSTTSSAFSTITSASRAPSTTSTMIKVNSTTIPTNGSSTATRSSAPGATTLTQTATQGVAQPTRATTPSSPQATGAAAALGFSSAALVGGVFMAVLGL